MHKDRNAQASFRVKAFKVSFNSIFNSPVIYYNLTNIAVNY